MTPVSQEHANRQITNTKYKQIPTLVLYIDPSQSGTGKKYTRGQTEKKTPRSCVVVSKKKNVCTGAVRCIYSPGVLSFLLFLALQFIYMFQLLWVQHKVLAGLASGAGRTTTLVAHPVPGAGFADALCGAYR